MRGAGGGAGIREPGPGRSCSRTFLSFHRRSPEKLLAGAGMSRELLSRLEMFQRVLLLIPPGEARGSRVLRGSSIHPSRAKLLPAARGAALGPTGPPCSSFPSVPAPRLPTSSCHHQPEAREGSEDQLVPIQANVLSHLGDHPPLHPSSLACVRLEQLWSSSDATRQGMSPPALL